MAEFENQFNIDKNKSEKQSNSRGEWENNSRGENQNQATGETTDPNRGFLYTEQITSEKTYELFSHRTAGLTYLLCLIFPQLLGAAALYVVQMFFPNTSDIYLFCAYFLTQATMAVGMFTALEFKFSKTVKRVHFEMPKLKKDMLLMIPFSVVLILGLNFLPSVFLALLEEVGYVMSEIAFPDTTTFWGFVAGVISICILPAFVEEFIFRGVILHSFPKEKAWRGILISAALFSLMHGSAQQTVYQLVMGVILGIVAVKTNSIVPCIFLHMLNNVISLLFLFISEDMTMLILTYSFVPALVGVLLFVWYFVKRKTPNNFEVEEDWQYAGSVQIKNDKGEVVGLSRDISIRHTYMQKAKKQQAIIFYSASLIYGIFAWVMMFTMGF